MNTTQERALSYFLRYPHLRVLFVFDTSGFLSAELSCQAWPEGYAYHEFDGAWFSTKHKIESEWAGQRVILLFAGRVSPESREQQERFPLMDALLANKEYKEAGPESFMQEHELPERFRPFVERNLQRLQSKRLRELLTPYLSRESFDEDVACRAMVTTYLSSTREVMTWEEIVTNLLVLDLDTREDDRTDFYRRLESNADARKSVESRLTQLFGMSYEPQKTYRTEKLAQMLKYNSLTQSLSLLPTDTYKSYKITDQRRLTELNRLYAYGMSAPKYSTPFRSALRERGGAVREEVLLEAYGADAPYDHMTERLCWAIVQATVQSKLPSSPDAVDNRMRELQEKMEGTSATQPVLRFVEQVAQYYSKTQTLGSLRLNTPEAYAQLYLEKFCHVDRHYRKSVEHYHDRGLPPESVAALLNATKTKLDRDYAKLCQDFNYEWLSCVKEKGAWFDSLSLLKQEEFFRQECDLDANAPKQAVIVSDALRYEVALDLLERLNATQHRIELSARRAMVPTETKYCKPSLLPHSNLRLRGTDMEVDGKSLTSMEQRETHLRQYATSSRCVSYTSLMSMDDTAQREVFKSKIVYVFHDTIDSSGHEQSASSTAQACRRAVDELSTLVKKLLTRLNVTEVTVTSDHGFLFNDMTFEDRDKHTVTEETLEKKSRYYLTTSASEHPNLLKMPLERVSGMTASSPTYVCVPLGTNRMAASGGYGFAHGGASLQELLIPVVSCKQRRRDVKERVGVDVLSRDNLSLVSSRLTFSLMQAEAVSSVKLPRIVTCGIYADDRLVTERTVVTLDSSDTMLENRIWRISLTLRESVETSLRLQLRIYDESDDMNPLLRANVTNNTLIEQDF